MLQVSFRLLTACSCAQVLPFLLLGIGVDDMFVIVRSLEEVDEKHRHDNLPIEARLRKCLAAGGMSITVTSLTSCTAFLFGSITSIPSIRWCATWLMLAAGQVLACTAGRVRTQRHACSFATRSSGLVAEQCAGCVNEFMEWHMCGCQVPVCLRVSAASPSVTRDRERRSLAAGTRA